MQEYAYILITRVETLSSTLGAGLHLKVRIDVEDTAHRVIGRRPGSCSQSSA